MKLFIDVTDVTINQFLPRTGVFPSINDDHNHDELVHDDDHDDQHNHEDLCSMFLVYCISHVALKLYANVAYSLQI